MSVHAGMVDEAVGQLKDQGHLSAASRLALETSADGMLLLAWLYEYGSYGSPVDQQKAYQFYQAAAEHGQMDAAHYCWRRCLVMTSEMISALKAAADAGDAQGLYLYSRWLFSQGEAASALARESLWQAANLRHYQAISELYVEHFLTWSGEKHSFSAAQDKLTRCADEGVSACYLLLGALYQRHGDAQQALHNYLILQQLDYGLFRTYLTADKLKSLEQRLPTGSLPVVQSRVATRLSTHPSTGFDVIDRYSVCLPHATYACIRKVAKRDPACMLGYYSNQSFQGFRDSDSYRRCMQF